MGTSSTLNRAPLPKPRRVYYSGSDTLRAGYAVCYDYDNATVARRATYVEQPNFNNLRHFAGVVVSAPAGAGPYDIEIVPLQGAPVPGVEVWTDENVAVDDILGPLPGTYAFGRGVMFPCLIATEAQNRSAVSGAGLVQCTYGKMAWDEVPQDKMFRHFDHFAGDTPLWLGGATLAEFLLPGYVVSGATAAAAGTSDLGGRLVLTPTTTTIIELRAGGSGAASAVNLLPFTLSAGRTCFFRARVNFGVGAVDNDVFLGLAITGACITDGTVPPLDDYLGFYMQGDVSGLINIATNRDNGTDNITSTGITAAADEMHDCAFLVRNRLAGDLVNNTTIQVFMDGAITNTLSSAAVNALINKDEAMGMCFGGIGGAAAVAIEIDRWEGVISL